MIRFGIWLSNANPSYFKVRSGDSIFAIDPYWKAFEDKSVSIRQSIIFPCAIVVAACSQGQSSKSAAPSVPDAKVNAVVLPFPPAGLVTDAANILSIQQRAALTRKIMEFEKDTSHQMAIVTTPTLGGRDIAIYTKDLANNWGVGRKDFDDGIVILIAPREKMVRISVGYGLEARFSNALCQQIIEREMLPSFRNGDFWSGIEAGSDAVIDHLK